MVLTPSERRALVIVVVLFAIGAGRDAWRALHPTAAPAYSSARAWAPRSSDSSTTTSSSSAPASHSDSSRTPMGSLDLNRATAEELDGLPGIGPVLAARIVEHRRAFGAFHRVEELRAVRGIGPRLLEKLRAHLRVGG